jgi:hypothetical protein
MFKVSGSDKSSLQFFDFFVVQKTAGPIQVSQTWVMIAFKERSDSKIPLPPEKFILNKLIEKTLIRNLRVFPRCEQD